MSGSASHSPTVRLLPETGGNLICVEFDGLVRAEDHERSMTEPLRQILTKHGTYRILIHFKPGYKGWEADAADLNLKTVLECAPRCERAAYINPPKKKILQMKLSPQLMKGQIRYFDEGQFAEALAWVRA